MRQGPWLSTQMMLPGVPPDQALHFMLLVSVVETELSVVCQLGLLQRLTPSSEPWFLPLKTEHSEAQMCFHLETTIWIPQYNPLDWSHTHQWPLLNPIVDVFSGD